MLTIKPATSPSAEPDPAHNNQATQVLFMHDEPEEPKQSDFKIATRTQGGDIGLQHKPADPKDAQRDVPEAALSDDYKKGMHNQTNKEDQDPEGQVALQDDAVIAQDAQPEKQVIQPSQDQHQAVQQESTAPASSSHEIKDFIEAQEKRIASADMLKAVIADLAKASTEKQEKVTALPQESTTNSSIDNTPQPFTQKIVSKKHRPAELGEENISKVQLSKETQQVPAPKKKLSLQDLQQGFSQFLQSGNEQYYSGQGNAQHDDAEGLRRASYYRQLGQMYNNAHAMAPNLNGSHYEKPSDNSIILITIERSGKISDCKVMVNSGVDAYDKHHMRIIESIGSFPPIPKYIEAPLQITATLHFYANRSSSGTFMPSRMRS